MFPVQIYTFYVFHATKKQIIFTKRSFFFFFTPFSAFSTPFVPLFVAFFAQETFSFRSDAPPYNNKKKPRHRSSDSRAVILMRT